MPSGLSQPLRFDNLYQKLIILLGFVFPLSVAAGNIVLGIIVLIWLVTGEYYKKFYLISKSKIAISSIVFFLIHFFGLIWTEDIEWGLRILKKMSDFLIFFPILLTLTSKKYINYYLASFTVAIFVSVVLSYLIWLGFIEPFHTAVVNNPVATMSHISFNPFLAVSIYLLINSLLYKDLTKFIKYTITVLIPFFGLAMFFTGGRSGQLLFFLMIFIVFIQYYGFKNLRSYIYPFLLAPSIFLLAYFSIENFENRVDISISNLTEFIEEQNRGSSIGQRITFIQNTARVIVDNPLIGVGTGDFPNVYAQKNKLHTPEATLTVNPHNMYLLIFSQLGLVGVFSLLIIFYYAYKSSEKSKDSFIAKSGKGFILLFIFMLSTESYLLGHFTTFLFVYFSSHLFRDFGHRA